MVNKTNGADLNKSKPRTISVDDALWERVMAAKGERSVSEWMREAITDAINGVDTSAVDEDYARLTAELDAALKLARAAEENVARLEADAVRIPPVPSVDTETVLTGLEDRILERASAVQMAPDAWLRGVVEMTLQRPIPGTRTSSKTTPQAPSTKHLERDPASRFASLTHAPSDSPNVKWQLGKEPGPPAWMTAPTTKPGMTRDQALGAGMEAARITMGGKAA